MGIVIVKVSFDARHGNNFICIALSIQYTVINTIIELMY